MRVTSVWRETNQQVIWSHSLTFSYFNDVFYFVATKSGHLSFLDNKAKRGTVLPWDLLGYMKIFKKVISDLFCLFASAKTNIPTDTELNHDQCWAVII